MKKTLLVLVCLFTFLLSAKSALAVQFKNGTDLSFPKEQKIDETIFISGSNINFDSSLVGDLLCVGQNIVITGNIKGDVLCAGQNIKVTGLVDGNIRIIGQTLDLSGSTTRNLYAVGQSLVLSSKSSVKGDVLFGAQTVDLSGIAGRDIAGAGERITVSGSLLRNALVTVSTLNVSDTASVGGNIDYFVDKDNVNNQTAVSQKGIKGEVRRHEIEKPAMEKPAVSENIRKVAPSAMVFKKVMSIVSYALLAFVLIYFSRGRTNQITALITQKPVMAGLIGLAIFVVAPIAIIISCITVVGLPTAFVILIFYILSMFIASLYSTILIGKLIMKKYRPKSSIYLSAAIGCLVVGVLSAIPVIGWLFIFVLFLMGLGASLLTFIPETKLISKIKK